MANLAINLAGTRHRFDGLAELMAKASPVRSGDQLAGLAAETAEQRVAAQWLLADLPLTTFLDDPVIPPERDEVTRLVQDRFDEKAFAVIRHLTVGGFREWLLDERTDVGSIAALAPGIMPEMVAAATKIMRNQDLVAVARRIRVVTRFRNTLGLAGRFSTRLQPNHPTDDPAGIAASIVDGLQLGSGDAVIGVNPAGDDLAALTSVLHLLDDVREAFDIPTQTCVLTHVTNTLALIAQGAPVDLCFQSIAGTEAANRGFGIDLALLREAHHATTSLERGTIGGQCMYFETGQGSCLSANAHHGVDQQTLEVRAYAVAREFDPLLVNSVVGFIGPEYLGDGKQILRAALEDHCCGKLLGLPMGLDICYTNHVDADQNDMDTILTVLAVAGVNFVMGVPGADDIMLGYQSTSFHDALYARDVCNLRPAPEFEEWLARTGLMTPDGQPTLDRGGRLPIGRVPALAARDG